eukprot:scpid77502/ scgid6083/ FH1/FH2 domain-containing protein 3; Formin homolog overexpressed in spleen 2
MAEEEATDACESESQTMTIIVKFIDDRDPFPKAYLEPTVDRYKFEFDRSRTLGEQIPALRRMLRAPHREEDVGLQLNVGGETQHLDLDSTLNEICEDVTIDPNNKSVKTIIVLRNQLSVRVHTCIETLLNAQVRDLRKALFALKRVFQEDHEFVQEFVGNEGLSALVEVGRHSEQSIQQYVLRALGELMLYLDGMNALLNDLDIIRWLHSLVNSDFRLVVKGSVELLLIFANFKEKQDPSGNGNSAPTGGEERTSPTSATSRTCRLIIEAVEGDDAARGLRPWETIVRLLDEQSRCTDGELLVLAMTLINKVLDAVPDQDSFYSVVDHLEDLNMETVILKHQAKRKNAKLLDQFQVYEKAVREEYDVERVEENPNGRGTLKRNGEKSERGRRGTSTPKEDEPKINGTNKASPQATTKLIKDTQAKLIEETKALGGSKQAQDSPNKQTASPASPQADKTRRAQPDSPAWQSVTDSP